MRNLGGAIVFLTRIPLRLRRAPNLTASIPWFPVAGAVIGVLVGGVAAGLQHLVPVSVAGAVAVFTGVLITGAFHEDGLADIADAFGGGWTVADRMRILKDPLHGSYGVAALCGSLMIRVVAVGALHAPAVAFASLVGAHTLARASAVGLMATVGVAGDDGLGAEYARALDRRRACLGLLVAGLIGAVATGWWVGPFALAATVGAGSVAWLARRKIGGITGDVLGAAEQVVECLILVTATGLAARYRLWWR